jgi:hypothetical protein
MLRSLYDVPSLPQSLFAQIDEFLAQKPRMLQTRRELGAALSVHRAVAHLPSGTLATSVVHGISASRCRRLSASLASVAAPFAPSLLLAISAELRRLYSALLARAPCAAISASQQYHHFSSMAMSTPLPQQAIAQEADRGKAEEDAATFRSKIFLWRLLYNTVSASALL